jgi:hypothetical protein
MALRKEFAAEYGAEEGICSIIWRWGRNLVQNMALKTEFAAEYVAEEVICCRLWR